VKPLERIRRTIERRSVDRVPIGPCLANWTANFMNIPLSSCCTDAEQMTAAQIAAWERIDRDVVFPDGDNHYLAQAFGCQVEFPKCGFPEFVLPAFQQPEQVFDLSQDGRMPMYFEATEHVEDRAVVHMPGTGSFAVASYFIT
jgi:uroporphyrinogen-III decarboxylase